MTRFETILNLSYTKCFTWIQVNQMHDRWKYTLPYQGSQRLLCFCCSPGWSGASCALLRWQRSLCVECSSGWHSYFSWANMTQDCVSVKANLDDSALLPLLETSAGGSWGLYFLTVPTMVNFLFSSSWPSPCDVMPLETGCHVQHNMHALFFFWPVTGFPV